ncbi:NADH-dependent [FeFe] hydrogenase, group A6 [Desulfoscipio geothermicus]|uniref:NAD(P)-dependent iron-only hydrogenase catalytic subunit n=1 Tax=Desulfoscipio geothermicus DSM 3669 TaxID=1121426 RepID=A0A1I6E7E6_9FIRM|nr:NADH-dependent [FeFe] hydrogenase, group A6 [Desulfoscipio geothermicus]SFR13472.1 NAD(P)-dependent iron-only hydrogenase catalytic subunit [Desulfoscipio geothermicus DSM 3669]
MSLINLTIDGVQVQAVPGTSVLEAAGQAGIKIPTLCYLKEINEIGSCRICLVEVEGARTLQASCVTPVTEGMVVRTNTPEVRQARKLNLELIMSNHPQECLICPRSTNCELQQLAAELGISELRFTGAMSPYEPDFSSPSLVRDPRKCILCRRCVSVCENVQQVSAIAPQERGFDTVVAPAFLEPLGNAACVNCGQCALVCPTAAIHEKDQTGEVWAALADPEKHVVVQTAPAVRVSIGEMFGAEPGRVATGQLVAALRKLGFDRVFDTDFTADLTIMEEGSELIKRLQEGGTLPLITSCSPGWIKFIEHFYPDLLPHLSTCKSPQQMFGALAKTYYAQKAGIDPSNIFVVSIMPCTAKKFEAGREEMNGSGHRDVDVALTTRELGKMLKEAGIDFNSLAEEEYDSPLGISTGAGVIFGSTGGVMEAALRTAYELVTGETLPDLEFHAVRGLEGVKETSVNLNGTTLNVAVAHGLANAREILERVSGGQEYHFIEIMCCPGGCIGGGGQPIPTDREIRARRAAGIYDADRAMPLRKSHENPAVQALYKEFLGEPLGHKSHELLHTHYLARQKY